MAVSSAEKQNCEDIGRLEVEGLRTLDRPPSFLRDEDRLSFVEVLRTVDGCLIVDYVWLDGRDFNEVKRLIEEVTSIDGIGFLSPEPWLPVEPDDFVLGQGRQEPPPDRFIQIDAGHRNTCGIRLDNTIACWGDTVRFGIPEGEFVEVSVGGSACVLDKRGSIHCWGGTAGDAAPLLTDVPTGRFAAVSVGKSNACGILLQGTVECWGSKATARTAPDGKFVEVSVGSTYACGLRTEGDLECWAHGTPFDQSPPRTKLTKLATGSARACGLTVENSVKCWSFSSAITELQPPSDHLTTLKIDSEGSYACGLRTNGQAICWSSSALAPDSPLSAPNATFTDLAVGVDHACGLRPDGSVTCWGFDEDAEDGATS